VAFNNHPGSTRSYEHVREHNEAVNRLDVIVPRERIEIDYEQGATLGVTQHDGSVLRLHKLDAGYDPRDRVAALGELQRRQARGEVVTGLLYVDPEPVDLHAHLGTVADPLNSLGEAELCPGSVALDGINAALR